MRKKILYCLFFLFSFNCHSKIPLNQLLVIVYKGHICSVIIDTNTIISSISFEDSQPLIGNGNNSYYIGNLKMIIFNNKTSIPYTLMLESSFYDGADPSYIAKNGTKTINIGIEKNFTITGNIIPYTLIDPITNPIIIRESDHCIKEQHTIKFFILESINNEFVDGIYKAPFMLYFFSP